MTRDPASGSAATEEPVAAEGDPGPFLSQTAHVGVERPLAQWRRLAHQRPAPSATPA